MPSTSWYTSTWPSQPGPAPMPTVGTSTASVTIRATSSGTPSSTMAKQPAAARALASATSSSAALVLAALHLEATHGVDGLRGEPEVSHHGDLGVDDRLDHRQPLAAALELHALRPGPDELGGVLHGLDLGGVVAHPRQVGDDERLRLDALRCRARQATGHGRGVVGEVVDGDLQGVVVAEHDHGDGVTDEDQVHPRLVGHPRAGRVVGRDHHERLAAVDDLASPDGGRGEPRAHRIPPDPSSALVAAGGAHSVGRELAPTNLSDGASGR